MCILGDLKRFHCGGEGGGGGRRKVVDVNVLQCLREDGEHAGDSRCRESAS